MTQVAKVAVRRLGVPACTKEQYEEIKKKTNKADSKTDSKKEGA